MNERIEKLALQAREYADELLGSGLPDTVWQDRYHEKFAELIVRECMDVASPSYMSTPEQGVYYVEQAIDRIAEHFGVE